MPDGTPTPIDNSLPPIPQKKAETFGDLSKREEFKNQALKLQSEGKLNPSIAKTFGIEPNNATKSAETQIPQSITETPTQPPTSEENEARVKEIRDLRQAEIDAKNQDIQRFVQGKKAPIA